MNRLTVAIIFLCCVLIMGGSSFAIVDECQKIDEFGDMPCEDEQTRLDNYGVQLYDAALSHGYIIFYEGKYWEGRNPRHGEAFAEATKFKAYLVKYRNIQSDRLVLINGGYREDFTVELYICPRGNAWPTASPTLKYKDVRFAKGRIQKVHYEWRCG